MELNVAMLARAMSSLPHLAAVALFVSILIFSWVVVSCDSVNASCRADPDGRTFIFIFVFTYTFTVFIRALIYFSNKYIAPFIKNILK